MPKPSTARVKKPARNVQITVRLTREQNDIAEQLAETKFDGNLSAALAHMIDVHGGKEVERAIQEAELSVVPYHVEQFKTVRLSRDLISYVAGLVRAGNMTEVACAMAGITPRQRTSWFKQGRNDARDGKQTLQADLVVAVAKAEAECEAEDIRRLREHGHETWTALAWRLERQYPDRYAQRKRIDGKVQHSLVPMIDYDRLSASELQMLLALLRKASPEADDPGISRTARPATELVPEDVLEIVDGDWEVSAEAPALEASSLEAPALVGAADGGPPAEQAFVPVAIDTNGRSGEQAFVPAESHTNARSAAPGEQAFAPAETDTRIGPELLSAETGASDSVDSRAAGGAPAEP